MNERFPQLRDAANSIQATAAILDGEIVALDENGLPRFEGLRSRRINTEVVFYAFDLLYLDGFDLTRCPLIKRKALLRKILSKDYFGTCDNPEANRELEINRFPKNQKAGAWEPRP